MSPDSNNITVAALQPSVLQYTTMKIKKSEKKQLDKAAPVGLNKAVAVIGSYEERLKIGKQRIADLKLHLETGGYHGISERTLKRVAVEVGLVRRGFGKYNGLAAPLAEDAGPGSRGGSSAWTLAKKLDKMSDEQRQTLLQLHGGD